MKNIDIDKFETSHFLRDFFKLGKLVLFKDNSYVTDEYGKKAHPTFDNNIFQIIDCNKPFPTHLNENSCTPINNLKVVSITTGKIYHCSNINILSIEHEQGYIKYDGQKHQIEEFFQNPFPFLQISIK